MGGGVELTYQDFVKIFGFYKGMNKPLPHLFVESLRWFSHFSISIYHSDSYWFSEPLYKEKPSPLLMREFPNYEYEVTKIISLNF